MNRRWRSCWPASTRPIISCCRTCARITQPSPPGWQTGAAPTISMLACCSPIGQRHVVTQCERNILHSLDDRPALDVLTEDVGEVIAQDWQQAAGYIFAGIVNKNSDLDDYSIRQLVGIDPDSKLVAIGDYLEHNDEIIFCKRDGSTALEDMERMLR